MPIGMERTAKIVYKHNIPVTCLIDTGTETAMKNRLDKRYEKYEDNNTK